MRIEQRGEPGYCPIGTGSILTILYINLILIVKYFVELVLLFRESVTI